MDEEDESIHELLGRRDGTESQAAKTKTISATPNTTISAGGPIKSVVLVIRRVAAHAVIVNDKRRSDRSSRQTATVCPCLIVAVRTPLVEN